MFFANLPDLNALWAKRKLKDHHLGLFHMPLFWVVIFSLISLFGFFTNFYSWLVILLRAFLVSQEP